jgi:hypothetical protein
MQSRGDIVPGDHFNCTLGADPAVCICYAHMVKRTDDGAAHEHSVFSEQWAAIMYCNCMTMTNCHPFVLHALVLHNGVPMSEDKKCISVVLRHPEDLAELKLSCPISQHLGRWT